ncbi:PilW family protein [Shewanella corallii]|uniref:PilW family protein n=1 Tax=Shewanella corallii TaxID=560080 RepID=A0ABT0N5B9_9GAMM|nr:PilW family protein [Shewanella corallii]MCL2913355.1 PilW family protein [Shewanella corallii]
MQVSKYQQGLSLVELMVAMVIGLFLTLGVFTMFSMSSGNVTTTSQFNQLQENGRIALALMEPDLSQLGFFGDITGTELIPGGNTQLDAAAPANDCVGAGVNNATLPNTTAAHFRRLWGYQQGDGNSLACLTGVLAGTDVIQIKRLLGPDAGDPPALNTNRYYIGTTANQAVIFTGDQGAPALENGRFWEYQHHVYYLRNDDNGVPSLRRRVLTVNAGMGSSNDEQLVEGVENMQILYGFDNDGDDTADTYMPSQNVTTLMWDNELFQRLVALRVFLLIRSIEPDPGYTNESVYQLGDQTLDPFNDNFRRKVVASTIVLENPVLIRN